MKRKKDQPSLELPELAQQAAALRQEVRRLRLEQALLKKANELLKKDLGIDRQPLTNREKTQLVDALRSTYGLDELLREAGLPRSSYFYHRARLDAADTHDYKRHGTTTLFAALNVLNSAVLAACKPRHRHQEFLAFLREIDKAVPPELDIHCIADNYATHSHPKIKAWLVARPRWHMHFIPTYSSWLNQVERFFSLITDKAIWRGSFTSVKQLVQRIDHFVAAYNTNSQPFKRTVTADSILEKLHRLCSRISGTAH